MLIVNIISFVILCTNIANSELSKNIKNNIKFQCGEILQIGYGHEHIDGTGRDELLFDTQKSFELKKDIKEEDYLQVRYGIRCGKKEQVFPDIEICDALESNDNRKNLAKSFINLFGFNATSCPIPAGNYTSKQENIRDSSLINFFGNLCNEDDNFWGVYGFINAAIIDNNKRIMNGFWEQVPKDYPKRQKCPSTVARLYTSHLVGLMNNRQ